MNKHSLPSLMKNNPACKIVALMSLAMMLMFSGQLRAAGQGDDVVLKAMTDEMARSTARLKMENLDKPYYLDYTIIDHEIMSIEASFGGIQAEGKGHSRSLRVSVRVGDYTLDNTNFVAMDMRSLMGMYQQYAVPVENDYDAIRQVLWLATDQAYKDALDSLSKKKACLKNMNQPEQIDSFARMDKPTTSVLPEVKVEWNKTQWLQVCRDLSSLFKKFPKINDSDVNLHGVVNKKYFVSSEGAKVIESASHCILVVTASTQAADGMRLGDFETFAASAPDGLPKVEAIARRIEAMAQRLSARQSAPVLDSYVGPVVFDGQAAGEFFRQLLGKNLCGLIPPLLENKMLEQYFAKSESGFKNKVGLRILPSFINVVADPLASKYEDHTLTGSYAVDDEGVPAQKVQLVEKGILKGFILSRTPVKGFNKSNGHGRSSLTEMSSARISNLFVQVSDGKKPEELKQQLIDLCKQQNHEYGLCITSLAQADLPLGDDDGMMRYFGYGSGAKETLLSKPVGLYKLFLDGHTEPVRGVEFGEITLNLLKEIAAATGSCYVHYFTDAGVSLFGRIGGVPATITAPAVLLEELELKKMSEPQQKPPFLPHPYFK